MDLSISKSHEFLQNVSRTLSRVYRPVKKLHSAPRRDYIEMSSLELHHRAAVHENRPIYYRLSEFILSKWLRNCAEIADITKYYV